MEAHHKEAIDIFLKRYVQDANLLAVLLVGSLAHGYAKPDSDIDLALVYGDTEYQKMKKEKKTAFSICDICAYDGGYVDCKAVDRGYLEMIAKKGSDPARYAFKDYVLLYSRFPGLEEILDRIVRFPVKEKEERKQRFASQVIAWKWYYGEAEKKQNRYLAYLSVQKLVLFTCRLILNENNMLYPYHKWLIAETGSALRKPDNFMSLISDILDTPSVSSAGALCEQTFAFLAVDAKSLDWPNRFLVDSEQNWITHPAPVDDI